MSDDEATSEFERATAVERRGETNVWSAEIHDGWDIFGNANGGYLLALAARAMGDAVGRPPVTITCQYLRPGTPGPCTIEVDVVRAGRRFATVSATLVGSSGDRVVTLLGTFGDQDPGGPSLDTFFEPFELPTYDECVARPATAETPAMMAKLDARFHPADVGYGDGRPSGRPEMRGWFAFADGGPIDAYGLLLAADAFAPPIFNTDLPVAWVPTVELTVHVRAVPEPGPLRGRFRSILVQDGLLDEEGVLLDITGRIVAQARQLALVPRG
ncbi:MAG: thioesterase family protein [Actinomycetota bacterium]